MLRLISIALTATLLCDGARAETPEEWIALGTRAQGGFGAFKYSIPTAALALLGLMNAQFDARKRCDAVMQADGLFQVAPVQ